jgi:Na+-translocating ferredoxin:NAD+ oxidoreductase RnfC subunit
MVRKMAVIPGKTTAERLEELGIVGAGGGGFPVAVKFQARAGLLIANAAECEPLLEKDKELLHHRAGAFFDGMLRAMELVGAREGAIGIKEKYTERIEVLRTAAPQTVRVVPLPDVYPAGDEFVLVHLVTGRVIPPGGLPKDVNVAVSNVETLVNIGEDRPVTHKYLTVAGAVKQPVTLRVPVGVTLGEAIEAAGGATVERVGVLVGGVMMGRPAASLEQPVTKTTGGIVVLPAEHRLIQRHRAPALEIRRIGRAACDQCRFCTEFCPRYLLGHPIEPHMAMRSLGFAEGADAMDPKNVCVQAKPLARERGLTFKGDPAAIEPHPMGEFRRVPMRRLMARLGLGEFHHPAPLTEYEFRPERVRILLKQHAGAAAVPVVRTGDQVREGDLVARPEPGKLGARVHASMAGRVSLEPEAVVIEAGNRE